ncbi:hypothetical protein D4764_13G0006120 [Takifugu flavidus]|uniref:Uncharacterized protein n=1 Tax=Takifugu flavidus TaxID=433684 RepID=A0A5C6PCG5_9TELE|nr:hypothetical protein D4764_13G0006120 [Takifugu flavidus]
MADYEEQLSDEEKVKSLISPRRRPRWRTFALAFAATFDRVRRRNPAAADLNFRSLRTSTEGSFYGPDSK